MSDKALQACPRCRAALQPGFAHRAAGLSFVAPEKLERFISIDEDLARSGLRNFLPAKAEYFRSYLCKSCELYLIDYSTTIDHGQAKLLAGSMTGSGQTANPA